MSRRLFTALTGIGLPSTAGGTQDVVRQYVGDAYQEFYKRKEDEQRAKDEKRRAEEAAKHEKYMQAVREKVKAGEMVGGEELVDLCRELKVDIHPRTVGMIRKRVSVINHEQARVSGRGPINGAYSLYKECRAKLGGTVVQDSRFDPAKLFVAGGTGA